MGEAYPVHVGGLPGKSVEIPSQKKQSYEEWLAERSRPGHIIEITQSPAATDRAPKQPQNGVPAKPELCAAQEDPENGVPEARSSKQQTFEEWLAARGNAAPTHVIGVSEDGGVEMYSHDTTQNTNVYVKPEAKPAPSAIANGHSHVPTQAAKRSEVTQSPAVNGSSHLESGSRTAVAGRSTVAGAPDSSQDPMLQSMLGEAYPSQQLSPAENGFHSARKPSPASSTEEARAHSAAQDDGNGSKPVSGSVGGATPDAATLKHQQYLEALIEKMQQDHDEKVCNPDNILSQLICVMH